MVDVACSYNMKRSTIGAILKTKDKIVKHVKSAVLMMSTMISKKRGKVMEKVLTIISKKSGKVMEEMEKLLSVWTRDENQHRVPLSLTLIQEEAKSLCEDLKKKHGEESEDTSVNASHGRFRRCKARASLHNIKLARQRVQIW